RPWPRQHRRRGLVARRLQGQEDDGGVGVPGDHQGSVFSLARRTSSAFSSCLSTSGPEPEAGRGDRRLAWALSWSGFDAARPWALPFSGSPVDAGWDSALVFWASGGDAGARRWPEARSRSRRARAQRKYSFEPSLTSQPGSGATPHLSLVF